MRVILAWVVAVALAGCASEAPDAAPAELLGGAAGEGGGALSSPMGEEPGPRANEGESPHPSPGPGPSGSELTPQGDDASVQPTVDVPDIQEPADAGTPPPEPELPVDAGGTEPDAPPAPPDASQGPVDAEVPPADAEPPPEPPAPACLDVAPDLGGDLLDCDGTAPCEGGASEHPWCEWAWPDAPPACRYAVVAWGYFLPDCQPPRAHCTRVMSDGWCTTALGDQLSQSRLATDNVLGWVIMESKPVVYSSSTGQAYCPAALRCP